MGRLRIGFYGLTGCAGCQLSVIFNEDELLDIIKLFDIRAFPFIKASNDEERFDLVFMEGLVASPHDIETLTRIRAKTKTLVALGACAHSGCIPAYRSFTLKENYEHLLYSKAKDIADVEPEPISKHVKVDYVLPGCPPDKKEILHFMKEIALGKTPKFNHNPVCVECRLNGNDCLLIHGKPCMGPITSGGCHAVCVTGGFECWGCRGPTGDANYKAYIALLKKKGYKKEFIKTRMMMFAGKIQPEEMKACLQ
ncbi:MAG: hypothetical protein HGA85_00045 [Nanoarchaeota archaeon]|nr:hypothetical protein [Nanoarchaeota archaeon]